MKYKTITGLTIQQCAEQFEDGDSVYLLEDIDYTDDEPDLPTSIWQALDYTNGSDESDHSTFNRCQERAARKDWILRKPINSEEQVRKIITHSRMLCQKFIGKVDSGRARSVETYNDCCELLELIDDLERPK